ncbi:MAG TPA: TonB-dependent receptor [Longimicrobiales bacterium]
MTGPSHRTSLALIAACALSAAIPVVASAQMPVWLRGVVQGAESGRPIPGVEVRSDAGYTGITDANGAFRLPSGGRDSVRITLFALGYLPVDTTLAVQAGVHVITMLVDPVELRGLEVLGNARSSVGLDGILPGELRLRREDIRAVPDLGEADLLRVLAVLPGVSTSNELSAHLNVRGAPADQTHVLLNGARVFAPYHMLGLVGAVNPDAVREMRLARGYTPIEHPGAAAGVLSLEPDYGAPPDLSGTAALGLVSARASLKGATDDSAIRWAVAGRHSHFDAISAVLGREGTSDFSFYDANASLAWTFAPGNELRATAFYSDDDMEGSFGDDESLRSAWTNGVLGVTWNAVLDPRWEVAIASGYSRYAGRIGAGGPGAETTDSEIGEAYFGGEVVRRWAPADARLGFRIAHDDVALAGGTDGAIVVGERASDGVQALGYVEAAFPVLERVDAVAGLRLFDAAGRALWEPRARAVVSDLPWIDELVLAATRSHQTQSLLVDDRYVLPGASLWIRHADDEPATRRDEISATLRKQWPDAWRAELAVYGARLENVLRWQPLGTRTLDQLRFDDGTSFGAELLVERHSDVWSAWLAYTLSRVTLNDGNADYHPSWDRLHALTGLVSRRILRHGLLTARLELASGAPVFPIGGYGWIPRIEPVRGSVGLQEGGLGAIFSDRQIRRPTFLRLDLGSRFLWEWGEREVGLTAGVLNVTGRRNVLFYEMTTRYAPPGQPKVPELRPVTAAPFRIFPSLEVDVRF